MSTPKVQEDQTVDITTCPLCLKKFNNPKQLECLHTFCQGCLNTFITSSQDNNEDGKVTCPVCKLPTRVPVPSDLSGSLAAHLPTNNLITTLVTGAPMTKESHNCTPCKRENKSSAAKHWCRDCFEPLCDNCRNIHKKIRQLGSHEILPMKEMQLRPKSQKMVESSSDVHCIEHTGRLLELYCTQHRKFCCVVCFANDHRDCNYVKTVEEMVNDDDNTKKLEEVNDAATDTVTKADEQIEDKSQSLTLLGLKEVELSEKVENKTREAIERLEALREKALENIKDQIKEEASRIEFQRDVLQRSKKSLELDIQYLDGVSKFGSPKQLFITIEKIQNQVEYHREILRLDKEQEEDTDYKFEFHELIEKITRKLPSIGELNVQQNQSLVDSRIESRNVKEKDRKSVTFNLSSGQMSGRSSQAVAVVTPVKVRNKWEDVDAFSIKMKKEKDYDGSMPSDRKITWFTGGVISLGDDNFMFADYNNHKLKRFKNDVTSPIMEYVVDSAPCDVALVEDDEILVTFPHANRINRYKLINNEILKEIEVIRTSSSPEGVAYVGERVIVAFSDCVKILEEDGREITSIPTEESDTYTAPMVASMCGQSFVHRDGDAIVCRSLDGEEMFRYDDISLRKPGGIAMDFNDNIYVCDCQSSNIHQIAADGQRGRVIRSSRVCVGSPVGLGFDKAGKRLWVTSNIHRSGQLLTIYALSN